MTPHTSAASRPAPAPVRRYTRDDLVRIGQADRPWEFLPLGVAALARAPGDDGLGYLLALNFARLGLGAAAREQIDALSGEAKALSEVASLGSRIDALPDARVEPGVLIERCRANVTALRGRGVDLSQALERWEARLDQWTWFETTDGNLLRRGARDGAWIGLMDQRGAAQQFTAEHIIPIEPEQRRPLVIEGMDPPWLLASIHRHTPPSPTGYSPAIRVIQGDPIEAMDGLAGADLVDLIADPRVAFFIGPDASQRLREELGGRLDTQVTGGFIPLLATRRRADPPVQEVLARVEADQVAELASLRDRVDALYAGRDARFWARRFASVGPNSPLRMLIPTCRFSTFVRHSSADLRGALERAGCRVSLLIEPDEHTRLSSLAYLRQFTRFEPDLVVLINYTRANMGKLFHPNVPFTCWVQDAMPHLFDSRIGNQQGDLDFLAGHTYIELFEQFDYPAHRLLPTPVLADEQKFHPGPIAADHRREHECDVAFVSHHGQTPEAMHERLCTEIGDNPPIRRVFERLFPIVRRLAEDPVRHMVEYELRLAAVEALRLELGAEPDQRQITLMLRQYCMPMADRILRHQMLDWAADLAQRHAWRLAIYGRGWENHPRLARFHRGQVQHDDDLRACYQAAAVHLHASTGTLVHQRVLECALSGGLPICRLHRHALRQIQGQARFRVWRDGRPETSKPDGGLLGYAVADSPEAMSHTAQFQRLGELSDQHVWCARRMIERFERFGPIYDTQIDAAWLLGDLSQTTFRTRDELEALVLRAIQRPHWRADVIAGIAGRVRERLTYDSFARRIIDTVGSSLADATCADRSAPKGAAAGVRVA